MRYKNCLCDGCGLPLKEQDDVVVCPDCGTPQHRECYKKNNCCVNEHRHGEAFEWAAPEAPVENKPEEAKHEDEMLPCPSCGHLNIRDAKVCENCSMRLIIFGMNLAEYKDPNQAQTEKQDGKTSDYPPPFTLGQGEGFNYGNMPDASQQNNTPAPPMPGMNPMPPVPPAPYGYNGQHYGNVPPPSPKQYFLSRFIGANYQKYMSAFNKLDSGKSVTFNWAAFFLSPYWFFYRKLYKPGIIFLTLLTLISIIFSPVYNEFALAMQSLMEITDEAAYLAYMQEIYTTLMPDVIIAMAAETAVKIIAGLIAYPLYKKYTENSLKKISEAASPNEGMFLATRLGGTSVGAVFIVWAALSVLDLILTAISGGSLF